MNKSKYLNYSHYLEKKYDGPKEFQKEILKIIQKNKDTKFNLNILDIGTAKGELIKFLSSKIKKANFIGIDKEKSLIEKAFKVENCVFKRMNILKYKDESKKKFDVIICSGLLSIFNEKEVPIFMNNVSKILKKKGLLIIFAPLNIYGIDMINKFRKNSFKLGVWESGWNIFSKQFIEFLSIKRFSKITFKKFNLNKILKKKKDPIRTWTLSTEKNKNQLTNGLMLLIDHYFIIIKK